MSDEERRARVGKLVAAYQHALAAGPLASDIARLLVKRKTGISEPYLHAEALEAAGITEQRMRRAGPSGAVLAVPYEDSVLVLRGAPMPDGTELTPVASPPTG